MHKHIALFVMVAVLMTSTSFAAVGYGKASKEKNAYRKDMQVSSNASALQKKKTKDKCTQQVQKKKNVTARNKSNR